MQSSCESSSLFCIVPAAGRGTRLGRLTSRQAKPSVAVSFDAKSGELTRMIDIPLEAIRQLGGTALVTTHYAPDSLSFVNRYDHVRTIPDDGYVTPIDSIIKNRHLLEGSGASTIGIVPADARLDTKKLAGLSDYLASMRTAAVILATKHLKDHNTHPVNTSGIVQPADDKSCDRLADLGVHLLDASWLLDRLDRHTDTTKMSVDIWNDIYEIDNPSADIALYVPHEDTGWVDMGTPRHLQETIYSLNSTRIDANANVVFPDARLTTMSTRTIALPSSTGLAAFHNAIIPERTTAMTTNEVVEVL